jgi:hypothetical protein
MTSAANVGGAAVTGQTIEIDRLTKRYGTATVLDSVQRDWRRGR